MRTSEFKALQKGARLVMPNGEEVTVESIQRDTDWKAWEAAGKPQGRVDEYKFTWAIETRPYYYVKLQDRIVGRIRRA